MIYQGDRDWSDRYLPTVKKIVGSYLVDIASATVDQKQATDLVVINAEKAIGCRVRRPGFYERYPLEFTMRSHRDSGAKTEHAKVKDGWCDWMFYGHAASVANIDIHRWFLLDLDVWREGNTDGKEISNGDGTYFRAFRVTDYPQSIIIGCGHKLRWPEKLPEACPSSQCKPVEYPVKVRSCDSPRDEGGKWLLTKCETCGRFFGCRPRHAEGSRPF